MSRNMSLPNVKAPGLTRRVRCTDDLNEYDAEARAESMML